MALFFNGQCCLANSKILFQPNYQFDGGMKAMKIKLMLLCLSISFSILAMKMLAIPKATAIFVPMAVPWV